MRLANYTKQERSLIILARILAVLCLGLAIAFAAAPDIILSYINDIGKGFFEWYSPKVTLGAERFWLVPAVSLLLILSYLCTVAQRDPPQYAEYMIPFLIASFVSAAGFGLCLGTQGLQFFYLIGALMSGIAFIVTLIIYRNAIKSRNRWAS